MDPMYVFDNEAPHMRGCDVVQDMTGHAKCNCREITEAWEKVIMIAVQIRDEGLLDHQVVDARLKQALNVLEMNGW